jgi:polar amino acid transport system substrate-binding protein
MMHKLKTMAIIAIAVIVLSSCSHMRLTGHEMSTSSHLARFMQKSEFVVGTTGDMPPLNMTTKNGEVVGFEMDIVRMMADAMGKDLKVKTMSFHELLPALELNKVDIVISGMTITPVRNLRFAFVGPYFTSGKAFLAKSETIANVSDATEINSPSTKVTTLKGSTSEAFVKAVMPKAQLFATGNYDQAIQLVLQDKVHALVADYPICIVALFRYPEAGFVSVHTMLTYEPYGIAMPADDPHFLNWVENFIEILKGSGQLKRLKNKWFGSSDWVDRVW